MPAAEAINSDNSPIEAYEIPRSVGGRLSSGYALFSIEEGWLRQAQLRRGHTSDRNNDLPCRLYCADCDAMAGGFV